MKAITFLVVSMLSLNFISFSQNKELPSVEKLTQELGDDACNCVEKIETYNKNKEYINDEVNKCISEQTSALLLGIKLMGIDLSDEKSKKDKDEKKTVEITVNVDQNSEDFKKAYYELERYMMENCKSLKEIVKVSDKQSAKSLTDNEIAMDLYNKGVQETEKKNYKKAINYYEKAIKEDPNFVFAWDNLGLNYRLMNNYDKAIECYERSLKIDPKGQMPLQNIAVAYQYKKEYQKAIDAYKRLSVLDRNNPEIYYGIGVIYASSLIDYELSLENMCKAYNLYVEQKSPYRTDAEKLINALYVEMKKQGKEKKFNEILKENKISFD
jgi:tetratricopeptide (TPR) repeat protein